MDQDILYHLALGNESHDLVEMFGDVKVSLKFHYLNDITYGKGDISMPIFRSDRGSMSPVLKLAQSSPEKIRLALLIYTEKNLIGKFY